MHMQYGDVAVTLSDWVATVEIQRPPHNLLDFALLQALATAFETLDHEAECRAIVLASVGTHFCAGAHFHYLQGQAEHQTWSAEAGNPWYAAVVRLHACHKPVIGAIHGAAIGGGFGLALVPDFRVLCPETRFAATEVVAHRAQVEVGRAATVDLPEEQRLLARVTHLRELVVWGEQWQQQLREAAEHAQPGVSEEHAEAFAAALELAHKVLNDREPGAKDKGRSLVDQDVRTGKHGDYYDGYLLDVSMEADSELICAMDVLPANGDEAAKAKPLIASEEAAHGNDIASLSIDRIGYRGDVLAELSAAAAGPQVTVDVPPIDWVAPAPELFQPDVFTLNEAGDEVCCPGGATSRTRKRTRHGPGGRFRFRAAQCRGCPLRAPCLSPTTTSGRSVTKSDYAAQYHAAQQRAQTAEYHAVRREHPRIERKVADLIRWHNGRQVRYRGRLRVKVQYLLTAVVVNCKRMVKLLSLPLQPHLT